MPKDGETEKRAIISNEYWKDKNSVEPPQYMTLSNKLNSKEAHKLLWEKDIKDLKTVIKEFTAEQKKKKEEKQKYSNLLDLNEKLKTDDIKYKTYINLIAKIYADEFKGIYDKKKHIQQIEELFKNILKYIPTPIKKYNLAIYKIIYDAFINKLILLPEINGIGAISYTQDFLKNASTIIQSLILAIEKDKYDDEIKRILGPEKVDKVIENLEDDKIAEDIINDVINTELEMYKGPPDMEDIENPKEIYLSWEAQRFIEGNEKRALKIKEILSKKKPFQKYIEPEDKTIEYYLKDRGTGMSLSKMGVEEEENINGIVDIINKYAKYYNMEQIPKNSNIREEVYKSTLKKFNNQKDLILYVRDKFYQKKQPII